MARLGHPDHSGNTLARLLYLRQGPQSVADYSVEFWTLAADSRWNEEELQGVFVQGLNESIKDKLAAREDPTNLYSLVSVAIQLAGVVERDAIELCERGFGRVHYPPPFRRPSLLLWRPE